MKSMREQVNSFADEISDLLATLILKHSRISQWNYPGSIVLTSTNFKWEPLSQEGIQLQSKAFEEYRHFCSLMRVMLAEQPDHTKRKFDKSEKIVTEIINQQKTSSPNITEAYQHVRSELAKQVAFIDGLYDSSSGTYIIVPDTNALLYNPDLDKWTFDAFDRFTIVLTPTVLSELDHHKINHRNEDVRKKANSLIGRIKDYRRRGRLADGVPIKTGKITLMAVAKEPNFSNTLPWLDSSSTDDRYLASYLEIMRAFPSSITILVTRDINLQNKAELARVPFMEPPDP